MAYVDFLCLFLALCFSCVESMKDPQSTRTIYQQRGVKILQAAGVSAGALLSTSQAALALASKSGKWPYKPGLL